MPPGREDDARAFYTGVLGLPERAKPAALAARGGCWFERGPLKVHLGVDREFRPARKAHPAFLVTGLAEIVSICRQRGYPVHDDDPEGAPEGCARAYVSDPFENRIELIEPR